MMAEAPPATHPQTVPFGDTEQAKPDARGKRVKDKRPTWIQYITCRQVKCGATERGSEGEDVLEYV